MNIDQLAARLARQPRPEIYRNMSDAEYSDGLSTIIADLELLARKDGCIAAAFALSFFDAATSYQVVRWQDIKPGEYYWVRLEHGQRWAMWDLRDLRLSMRSITEAVEIRGPIPRPE